MMARYSILGSHLTEISELHQVQPHILLWFLWHSCIDNLSVISGLCVGPKLTTASALDSLAVLSEAKGNKLQDAIIVL